jgi:hypothetical protein
MLRPLTKANVEKHLGAMGLEAEFATHAHIRGLSGGQKVRACGGWSGGRGVARRPRRVPRLATRAHPSAALTRGARAATLRRSRSCSRRAPGTSRTSS